MNTVLCCLFVLTTALLSASKRDPQDDNLAKYLARAQQVQPAPAPLSLGSIWIDSGRMASLSTDYKAMITGDLITIVVAQDVISSNAGSVGTARSFSASSGITALPGKLKVGSLLNLFGLNSAETLSGKGQAASATSVTTTLAGRVVVVLSSGNLVVEAERVINVSNEKQTIILRGIVRRGDIGPNNTVGSNNIGDLELEIKGKGVISDGVRPPHPLLRAILRILNF